MDTEPVGAVTTFDSLALLPPQCISTTADFDDESPTEELVRLVPETSIRRRRRTRPRSQTIAMKRVSRAERAALAELYPVDDVRSVPRPTTRADCREQAGPCPWVACKHHLYLDINPVTGSIKINFPDLEPWELKHTCALAVAEQGAMTLEQVGEITNLTRERVRQLESVGLAKLSGVAKSYGLR